MFQSKTVTNTLRRATRSAEIAVQKFFLPLERWRAGDRRRLLVEQLRLANRVDEGNEQECARALTNQLCLLVQHRVEKILEMRVADQQLDKPLRPHNSRG